MSDDKPDEPLNRISDEMFQRMQAEADALLARIVATNREKYESSRRAARLFSAGFADFMKQRGWVEWAPTQEEVVAQAQREFSDRYIPKYTATVIAAERVRMLRVESERATAEAHAASARSRELRDVALKAEADLYDAKTALTDLALED